MATINIDAKCDLNKPVVVRHLDGMVFSQDVKANMIRVSVFRNREPVDLSGGSVSANIIRADGATVVQTGTIEGNVCSVVLPSSAYAVPGQIAIFVKHSTSVGPTTSTIAAITGYVYKSTTDTIVDPGSVVPNVNQLLAMIEDCEEATEACIAATAAAPVVDDTAGAGDTDKVWSADKSAGEAQSLMTEINSKADKTVTDALHMNKAPVIIDSATGNPIVLTDGADGLPVDGMKIHFLPVQDLHGYNSPWPAGGGANKLPCPTTASTQTKSGVTLIVDGNGQYKISGSNNSGSSINFTFNVQSQYIGNAQYLHCMNDKIGSVSGSVRIYLFNDDTQVDFVGFTEANRIYNGKSTLNGKTINKIQIRIMDGCSVDGVLTFTPMLLDTNSVTDWIPYSNICPIEGWTGVTAWRAGKNILSQTNYKDTLFSVAEDGTITQNDPSSASWSWLYSNSLFRLTLPPGTYSVTETLLDDVASTAHSVKVIAEDDTIICSIRNGVASAGEYSQSFTLDKTTKIGITIKCYSARAKLSMVVGETASPYTPYVGQSYPVTFPDGQTVYGGTPDVVNGVLRVEYRRIVADGTNVKVTGGYGSAGSEWLPAIVLSTADKGVSGYAEGNLYASYLAYNQGSVVQTTENTICMASSGGIIALHIGTMQGTDGSHGYSSADELKTAVNAYLAEHNLEITYKLATPIEIPLSNIAAPVTLLGDNTIWSDANGTIELDYRADTKLFIAKNKQDIRATIAPIEDGATASQAYSAGKFFYRDGNFCKAKTSIASGATFTLNTNYEVTTIADELFALN